MKLRQVEVLMGQGMPRIDAIRQISVTEQIYYRWKEKYGGMGTAAQEGDDGRAVVPSVARSEHRRKLVARWMAHRLALVGSRSP